MKQSPPSPKLVRWFKYGCSFLFLPTFVKNWLMPILGHLKIIDLNSGRVLKLTNGARFKIKHLLDVLTILEVNINNDYHFPQIIKDQPFNVIDIGGNIGAFAVFAAQRGRGVRVYSYEPSRTTLKLFRQNVKLNKLESQIIVRNQAVFKKNTTLKLYSSGPSGLASIYQTRNEKKFEVIPAVTLSDIFKQNNIKHCDFLKIDCEGAEYDILSNTPAEVFNKISQISLEFHEITPKQNHHSLIKILENQGFRVEHKYHGTEHDIGYIYASKQPDLWTHSVKATVTPVKRLLSGLSIRVRSDQYNLFTKTLKPSAKQKVLDVGATSGETLKDSNMFEKLYPYPKNLTAATIEDPKTLKKLYPQIKTVKIEPQKKLPFKNKQFDIAVSWATLEHVGGYQQQHQFLNELLRVAKKIFVTTPYRACPYEPHTGFWFIHWLPLDYLRWIAAKTGQPVWASELNLNPLLVKDLQKMKLKPRNKIKIYKMFGFFPSHLVIHT